MQKNITPKGFKECLRKSFLTMLVLCVSFGVSFAQSNRSISPMSGHGQRTQATVNAKERSDVPAMNKSLPLKKVSALRAAALQNQKIVPPLIGS